MATRLAALLVLLAAASAASAPPSAPDAHQRWRPLSADPNAPAFGLEHRAGLRGQVGAELPLVGRRGADRWSLQLAPLMELSNDRHADFAYLPNESWRARLGAELWWLALEQREQRLSLGLLAEHESDHDTARTDSRVGFLSLNNAALRLAWSRELLGVGWTLEGAARGYFLSCTRLGSCAEARGSFGAGGALGLVLDLGGSAAGSAAPYAALEASGVLPGGELLAERRLRGLVGVWMFLPSSGLLRLFISGYVGNDLGIGRAASVRAFGAGLGWTPR